MEDEVFMIEARKCKRCGRLLTSKDAIEKGYGCQCALREAREAAEREPLPGQRNIFDWLEEQNGN